MSGAARPGDADLGQRPGDFECAGKRGVGLDRRRQVGHLGGDRLEPGAEDRRQADQRRLDRAIGRRLAGWRQRIDAGAALQYSPQRTRAFERHRAAAGLDQRRVAAELDGVAKTALQRQQNRLPAQRPSLPARLGVVAKDRRAALQPSLERVQTRLEAPRQQQRLGLVPGELGPFGRERHRALVGRQRLVVAAHVVERRGAVRMGAGGLGRNLERGVEIGQRLLGPVEFAQHHPAQPQDLGPGGPKPERAAKRF